jgi:hypothetical protein
MLAVRFLDETRSGGDLSCADYRAGLVEIRQRMAARTAMRYPGRTDASHASLKSRPAKSGFGVVRSLPVKALMRSLRREPLALPSTKKRETPDHDRQTTIAGARAACGGRADCP